MRLRAAIFAATLALGSPFYAANARGEDHFASGVAALDKGRFDEAISELEAYADREPSHPDASFDRGLAYLTRVRANAERPGDLGQAAAAFQETLLLDDDDDEAEHALELVHAEVARRWARRGKDVVQARPTLDRVVLRLAPERAWGIAAIAAAALLALGLVLRSRPRGPVHLAGTLMTPAGALALCALVPLTLGARHLRLHTQSGVLIVSEAFLSDEEGAAQGGPAIPEAALLEIGARRGSKLAVRYGTSEGWLAADAVRVLRED